MRRTYLGEFEEVTLLMAAILDGQAHGVTVSQKLEPHPGRQVPLGTVHNTLMRLEEKGFVTSGLGGGRRKRLFRITATGSRALQDIPQFRQGWQLVPPHTLQPGGA